MLNLSAKEKKFLSLADKVDVLTKVVCVSTEWIVRVTRWAFFMCPNTTQQPVGDYMLDGTPVPEEHRSPDWQHVLRTVPVAFTTPYKCLLNKKLFYHSPKYKSNVFTNDLIALQLDRNGQAQFIKSDNEYMSTFDRRLIAPAIKSMSNEVKVLHPYFINMPVSFSDTETGFTLFVNPITSINYRTNKLCAPVAANLYKKYYRQFSECEYLHLWDQLDEKGI